MRNLEHLSMRELDALGRAAYEVAAAEFSWPWYDLEIEARVRWHRAAVAVLVQARRGGYV